MRLIHYLLLLFIVVPSIEILFFFKISGTIGAIKTFLVIIITGFIGAYLAKQQGLRILNQIKNSLQQGRKEFLIWLSITPCWIPKRNHEFYRSSRISVKPLILMYKCVANKWKYFLYLLVSCPVNNANLKLDDFGCWIVLKMLRRWSAIVGDFQCDSAPKGPILFRVIYGTGH